MAYHRNSIRFKIRSIGTTPQHPILATAIRIILKNIHGRANTNKSMTVRNSPYEMTSTIPLGRAFQSIRPPLKVPGGAVLIDFKALWGLKFFWGDEIVIVKPSIFSVGKCKLNGGTPANIIKSIIPQAQRSAAKPSKDSMFSTTSGDM